MMHHKDIVVCPKCGGSLINAVWAGDEQFAKCSDCGFMSGDEDEFIEKRSDKE